MLTDWGALTDAGGRRAVNEDAVFAVPPVFGVADGMGGHTRGALASAAVVEAFEEFARGLPDGAVVQPADVLAVIDRARERIRSEAGTDGTSQQVMGSTVAGVVGTVHNGAPYWLAFNVGDSRIYRHDEHGLEQISVDHSVVQELLEAGAITAPQAERHPQRHVITRAVGSGTAADADFWMLHAGRPHRLLLCSDGLTGEVGSQRIEEVLAQSETCEIACERLVRDATHGGARDNVSVVVVQPHEQFAGALAEPQPTGDQQAAEQWGDLEDTLPHPTAGAPQ